MIFGVKTNWTIRNKLYWRDKNKQNKIHCQKFKVHMLSISLKILINNDLITNQCKKLCLKLNEFIKSSQPDKKILKFYPKNSLNTSIN